MKNKYLIRIKGLSQDEQTEFIEENLKDNIIRLKIIMIMLLIVEIILLALNLIPSLNIITAENPELHINMYLVVIAFSFLFLVILHYIGSKQKEKNILFFRLIILTGLMLLLLWGASFKLIGHNNLLQPHIYILILLSVSAIPFLNPREIVVVTLPSLFFLTTFSILDPAINNQQTIEIIMDGWGFTLLAIMFSAIIYKDRVQYFKKDMQLIKQNSLLKKHSEIDALTNIFNRRKLDETMDFEWIRSSRTKQPIAFLLIDLDNFKNYNDLYGHIEGDMCLRKVSAIMKESLKRSTDMIFRYGGEEFGAVLLFTDINAANIVAEKIRKNVESAGIIHKDSSHGHVTVSIGLTASIGNKDDDYHAMYIEADKALYAAKRSGRNKVIAFEK